MSICVGDISLLGLVTLASCYQLARFAIRVGESRRKHKVEPPRMDGPEELVRVFRAQQNSLEYFPLFMGCLWVSGLFFHQVPAAVLGLYYMHCRENYFKQYCLDAKARVPPFKKSVNALRLFLAMGLAGTVNVALRHFFGINIGGALLKHFYG